MRRILLGLIDSIEAEQEKETERKRRLQERNTFSEDELEICARIRYLLMEGGKDVEQLKFH